MMLTSIKLDTKYQENMTSYKKEKIDESARLHINNVNLKAIY